MNAETTLCEFVPRSHHKSAIVCGITWSGPTGETVFVVHCKGQKALDTMALSESTHMNVLKNMSGVVQAPFITLAFL